MPTDRNRRRVAKRWEELEPVYKRIIKKHPKLAKANGVNHLGTLGTGYMNYICDAGFSPNGGYRFHHDDIKAISDTWGVPILFSGFGFSTRTFYRTRWADTGFDNPVFHPHPAALGR